MKLVDVAPVFSPSRITDYSCSYGRAVSAPPMTRPLRSILKGSSKLTGGSRSCPTIQRVCFADGIAPSKHTDAFPVRDTLRITKEGLEDFLRTQGLENHYD